MTKRLKSGDHVVWNTSQGETSGTVVKKEKGRTRVKGHVAAASPAKPQFRVRSDKSGDEAVHKPEALKKA